METTSKDSIPHLEPHEEQGFVLDNRLQQDCEWVLDFRLCRVLLMQDNHYPWFILVPRRPHVKEIYQLSDDDLVRLMRESAYFGKGLMQLFNGDKMNVAALGNVVSQLHVHHVVRYRDDAAWPAPVWGKQPTRPYSKTQLEERIMLVREYFSGYVAK